MTADFIVPNYLEKHMQELRDLGWTFQIIYASFHSPFGTIQLHASRHHVIIVGRGITHEDAHKSCLEAVFQYSDGPMIAIYKGEGG